MASMSGWSEAVLISLAIVAVISIVVVQMNVLYDKDYSTGFSDTSNSEAAFEQYMSNSQSKIEGGTVTFDATQGISLQESYGLAKDVISTVWSFISGGWIENVMASLELGEAALTLGHYLRILFFISVVFALLYILFKVTT